ncbi:hypothetical protein WPS_17180 [Vulcanimicrobium alpinum]|uniref:GGDEF domain-containing protein n=1 Tax=Vulcanimicrobium alpinum TaxID=3016050 RepID=A0AAN1XY80_UNVUL|nr:GGDEF domain-containing protein [Vulcanimicrobium alpinum]BDE06442.1 hypothetical protein WPS_17180 [Vulcanimicrobium alpinum]
MPALVESAAAGAALVLGAGSVAIALRAQASARADRLALRLAREREAAFVEAARRLADAARDGVDAVRDEIARATAASAPVVDGVLVYDERDGALRCVRADGARFAHYAGSQIALDDPHAPAARALAARHRITLADAGVRPIHPADVTVVAIPLAFDPGGAAVLAVASRTVLDRETQDRLVTLGDQASPAYRLARERERDRRSAEYDGLTGLLTPRAFRRRLARLVERARFVPGGGCALAFLDTDRFKEWNDAYGHACGDALLREIAAELRAAARSADDLAARNGGDEFCIVFAAAGKADAIERAETLRRRIAALDFERLRPGGAARVVSVTASIGVAVLQSDAANASELLERADAAMYHAKHTGRDGVSYVRADGTFARFGSAAVPAGAR